MNSDREGNVTADKTQPYYYYDVGCNFPPYADSKSTVTSQVGDQTTTQVQYQTQTVTTTSVPTWCYTDSHEHVHTTCIYSNADHICHNYIPPTSRNANDNTDTDTNTDTTRHSDLYISVNVHATRTNCDGNKRVNRDSRTHYDYHAELNARAHYSDEYKRAVSYDDINFDFNIDSRWHDEHVDFDFDVDSRGHDDDIGADFC